MEDGKVMIKIIYEDNHLLVVEKPVNIPVQADDSKDKDLLTMLKEYIKNKYNKPGNVYLGLVHRLDRPVGGVMVFAKTSKAASRLSEQIRCHKLKKIYQAVVLGKISESGELKDKLLKDPKTNIVNVDEKGKEAILNYHLDNYNKDNNLSLITINLKTGRSHQIRVQLSHAGYPLYGDQKYNKNAVKAQICLWATELSFEHPISKEILTFKSDYPSSYPWNIFNKKN